MVWDIDIEADTPLEAAQEALRVQRDPESSATFFEVVDIEGKKEMYEGIKERAMTETVKGEVGFIKTRSVSTRNGVKPSYSVKLEDGPWVSFGFKKPDFDKGAVVEFEVSGEYNDVKSHRIISQGSSGGAGSSTAGGTPKDRMIVRQNALSHATAITLALLPELRPTSDVVAERAIKLAERFEGWVMDDDKSAEE